MPGKGLCLEKAPPGLGLTFSHLQVAKDLLMIQYRQFTALPHQVRVLGFPVGMLHQPVKGQHTLHQLRR